MLRLQATEILDEVGKCAEKSKPWTNLDLAVLLILSVCHIPHNAHSQLIPLKSYTRLVTHRETSTKFQNSLKNSTHQDVSVPNTRTLDIYHI